MSDPRPKVMEMCQVAVTAGMDDEMLRVTVEAHPVNGSYAVKICRKCGRFRFDEEGNAKTAKIVGECKGCVEVVE